jgi:hypothetical protein
MKLGMNVVIRYHLMFRFIISCYTHNQAVSFYGRKQLKSKTLPVTGLGGQ